MSQETEEREVVKVRYVKRTYLEIFKNLIFAAGIAMVFNAICYGNVSLNHLMAKGVGIAQDFASFCASCFQAI